MTLESLEKLQDNELEAVIARSQEMLRERDRKRKEQAMEDARAILLRAGLTPQDLAGKGKGARHANGKGPVYRTGHQYQHPVNKGLVWNAKGQKPNWLRELEKERKNALEVN
jgi:DNA-binding protein H-NS